MSSGDDERGMLGNEGSDVSREGVGTNPQPAVILVLDPSIQDEKLDELKKHLLTLHISSFTEKSSDHIFLCLYLKRDQTCDQTLELAHIHSYHVPFMCPPSKKDSESWRSKFASLYSYGTLSYKNFTKVYYTVMYHKRLKDKFDEKYTKKLYKLLDTVRVQAELIYASLKAEKVPEGTRKVLEREDYKIIGDFVPHSPEAKKLEEKLSWFPPFFPLKEFRNYFGEELAFVYAWSNYWWTFGLLPIAILSLISLLYGLATELNLENVLGEKSHFWRVFSSVVLNPSIEYYVGFLVVWISVFQYQWSKAAPIFSLQWGVANYHKEEDICKSTKNKGFRKYIRIPNLIISLGGFFTAAILTCALWLVTEIVIRYQLNKLDFGVWDNPKRLINKTSIISFICSIFYTILNHGAGSYLIPWLSDFLTRLENHKFQSYFNNSVIFKHTGYYLMSSYWYLAYIVLKLNFVISERFNIDLDALEECPNGICVITLVTEITFQMLELRLAYVVITLLKSIILWIRRKKSPNIVGSCDLRYILDNYKSLTFLSSAETSTWMGDRVLMYGYITLFSYHLPIVALMALILETFITYYEMKMLLRSQRPQPRRVGNIKQWEGIIYLINIMCIVINSYSINQRVNEVPSEDTFLHIGAGSNASFYFMPLFIFLTSLIHIQDSVSGDRVQYHVHQQYQEAMKLLSSNTIEVDGTRESSMPVTNETTAVTMETTAV
ncbi:uncharacterized protein LOC134816416 [Bolinopsis microptera]|uniref:uncharacterized protein LOC134816416 n=1 Tax=Bolinopsis microptera TaxID=2820187 RepID=UPI00307AEE89